MHNQYPRWGTPGSTPKLGYADTSNDGVPAGISQEVPVLLFNSCSSILSRESYGARSRDCVIASLR